MLRLATNGVLGSFAGVIVKSARGKLTRNSHSALIKRE
jgi:hypothetical protein